MRIIRSCFGGNEPYAPNAPMQRSEQSSANDAQHNTMSHMQQDRPQPMSTGRHSISQLQNPQQVLAASHELCMRATRLNMQTLVAQGTATEAWETLLHPSHAHGLMQPLRPEYHVETSRLLSESDMQHTGRPLLE